MAVRGGNKPKAPGRGAVPLKADAKDLRIAQLEAQLRRLKKVPVQVASAKKKRTEPLPPQFLWVPINRLRRKSFRPAAPLQHHCGAPDTAAIPISRVNTEPEDQEAAERRLKQNAHDLQANLEMVASDPGVGRETSEPSQGQPRLQQELLAAANGRRFTQNVVWQP